MSKEVPIAVISPLTPESVFKGIVSSQPNLKPLIEDMTLHDPITFLHQLMVCHCYSFIKGEYVKQLESVNNPKSKEIGHRLNKWKLGAFLHDLGKYGIGPTSEQSAQIVNHIVDGQLESTEDLRDFEMKARHKLHPIIGPLLLSPKLRQLLGHNIGMISNHHAINLDELSIVNPIDRLAILIMQLSDASVVAGQPRPNRPFRLSDEEISREIRKVLSDRNLLFVFGRLSVEEIQFIRNNFITMTLKSIHQIQEDYPEEDCLEPENFYTKLLPNGIRPHGVLETATYEAWKLSELKRQFDKQLRS